MLVQAGVVPYRRRDDRVEVLLITSRTRGHWIIPKGHIEPNLSPLQSAVKEAYEEAGVRGRVRPVPFGHYLQGPEATGRRVVLFLMEVDVELPRWPESEHRLRAWFALPEAIRQVGEDDLRRLLREMAELFL